MIKKYQQSMGTRRAVVSKESGYRFRLFRKEIQLTQKELAAELGRAQATLARYEKGFIEPHPDVIKYLHDKYGLSYSWYSSGVLPMIETVVKRTSVTDMNELRSLIEMQQEEIKRMNVRLTNLHREVFALKNPVEKEPADV